MMRHSINKFVILSILFLTPCLMLAQEGRFGQFGIDRPPSDLDRAGLKGKVRKVISYEGMATRTKRGVVFSEDPLKVITEYNRAGNIVRQTTLRYGRIIERSDYTYSGGLKQTMKTTQGNGVVSATVRYFHDANTKLNNQQNSYNYQGKLTQISKFVYNRNKDQVRRVDYTGGGAKDESFISKYNMDNILSEEYSYRYIGGDSILQYEIHYNYNSRGNVIMQAHRVYDSDTRQYDKKILHFRYYQYDREGNWAICCRYHNALTDENRLVPNTIVVREIIYY